MRGRLVALVLGLACHAAGANELQYPPNAAQRTAFVELGWPEARDRLAGPLIDSYLPGLAGRSGSTGMTGYKQWLTLYKWADLLARTEREEAIALLGRHLYRAPGAERATFVRPGLGAGADLEPAPRELVEKIYDNPENRSELLGILLPGHLPAPAEDPMANRLDPALVKSWVEDPAFSGMFLDAIAEEDYLPGVLWNLQEIAKAHPEAFGRYPGLAIAISVVHDARRPEDWPHHQVDPATVPVDEVPPADWFAQWVKANEERELIVDLRDLPPAKLKFVVDAPLAESEFAWARKNAKFPRSDFGRAFSSIKYDFKRLKDEQYAWPHGDYRLADIEKNGGICVDQAYFAMVVGKARGLPTLYFRGQGSDGGHAWFGYLKSADRWELDAGRYENQNYAVGEALDPQSWRPISDHQLKALAEGFREKPQYAASADDLLIAALAERVGRADIAAKAFRSAVEVCPENPEAWRARGEFLARSGAPADERKNLHEEALKRFANQRDLRVTHQLALAAIARETGDLETASAIEKKIVSQNRRLRSDLSVDAAARQLADLVDQGRLDDAFAEYRKMLRSLKDTGGGNFFYDIVQPFTEVLSENGDASRAIEATELARTVLRPDKDSILDREFVRLQESLQSAGGSAP